MRIAVIGAGNVGGTLGRRWAAVGHQVTFGVREGGEVKGGAPPGTRVASVADACASAEVIERGKIACALCHGVTVLRYARLSNGKPLAEGKTVTGFANVEEDFADHAAWSMNLLPRDKHVMPWRIEDELKRLGSNYVQAGLWRGFAVRDGNLITGQQNFSGTETAELIVETLGR